MPEFITYNILNDHWKIETNFKLSEEDSNSLDTDSRFELIKKKLKPLINNNSIIALQEVSNFWGCKLFTWFYENSYMFKVYNYGSKWSDHMGIALAFPISYKIIDCSQMVIGESIKTTEPNEPYYEKLWYYIWEYFNYKDEREFVSIRNAKRRHNGIMGVKLLIDNKLYWFATYHFPCAFYDPLLMNLHAEACIKWLEKLDGPVIFGSDMNSLPNSNVYKLFKEKFKSVYYEEHGKEPVSTNKVDSKRFGKFSGTIDYIWVSKEIKINSVKKILDDIKVMPNINEPSDHLPIICEIELN
jgi:mRNA deadenylase 3'-5' endonuclease subunit Ccr4